ncbi:MAG: dihydrofolate synthase [Demequinaceae bacterium]|nr:dihydrofolate synthase [Demequinaceae bacterium]
MIEIVDLLGHPERAFRVVHIAGTNGKTSTARMVESLLRAHGLRTGLFTSPHLTTVRERIRIDGRPISQVDFIRLWMEVAPIVHLADAHSADRGGPRLSFFEVLTVLGFAAFADAPVDVAVIEVGLGGRWDATNVVEAEVAVVAPVALDHARYLGTDLAGIAREKAGIIKDDARVVVAEQPDVVRPVIRDAIKAHDADAVWEGEDIEIEDRTPAVGGQVANLRTRAASYEGVFIPLLGEYQAHNALLALAAVEALLGDGFPLGAELVEQGFAETTSPGRLETVRTSPLVIVDAAHNPHGASALADALEESFALETIVGVVGILDDKDPEGILSALEPVLDKVVITASLSTRALPAIDLALVARQVFGDDRVEVEPNLPDAIDRAVALAEGGSDLTGGVVVTGSITLVAEARLLFGVDRKRGHA